jgi:hypothetical protein
VNLVLNAEVVELRGQRLRPKDMEGPLDVYEVVVEFKTAYVDPVKKWDPAQPHRATYQVTAEDFRSLCIGDGIRYLPVKV